MDDESDADPAGRGCEDWEPQVGGWAHTSGDTELKIPHTSNLT